MKWSVRNILKNAKRLWGPWKNILATITTIIIIAIFCKYLFTKDFANLFNDLPALASFLSNYMFLLIGIIFPICVFGALCILFFRLSSKWSIRKKAISWTIIIIVSISALCLITSNPAIYTLKRVTGWIILLLMMIILMGLPMGKESSQEAAVSKPDIDSTTAASHQLVKNLLYLGALAILVITILHKKRNQ